MELCFFNVHSSFSAKRIKITDVNPHLICVLCGGYYIDATTIIECLHSFCKSCIVKYLEKNKYCPICDVQIHKTYPLLNIRSDKTLQNIVYKLVPSLFKDEMQRRVSFYEKNPHLLPSVPEDRGQITDSTPILFPDELLIICLDYHNDKKSEQGPKRYFHCPASMTVAHLGKLIRGKFSLTPTHQVNIFFKEDYLQENLTVMDIVYTYQCRRKVPIRLTYRILELKKKTIKLMPPVEKKEQKSENEPPKNEETKMDVDKEEEKETVKEKEKEKEKESEKEDVKEWKEVQLQISENGVMSVRNMEKSECSPKPAIEAPARVQSTTSPTHPTASMTSTQAKPQNGPSITIPGTKLTMSHSGPSAPRPSTQPIVSVSKVSKDQVKKDVNVEVNKLSISRVSGKKGETLNKIVSKLSPNERVIGNTSVTIRPVVSPPRPTNIQPKSKDRKPIPTKYKTLTSPTKQWNPSIDRSTMLTLKQNCDMSKPPRFFKMRNMPRFLGNPSSGVKPMYATEESQKPRSPTKLPPPYTPGSPKTLKPYDKTWTPGIPSPAHSSPFLHPSNPYHLLYSGYPYSNDSFNNTELLRSMCASTAFHPSLPPSISMLFNPLHNLRPMDTPPVQRIPRSKSPLKIEDKPDRVPSTSAKSESPKSQPQPNKAIPLPPPPKLNPVKSPEKMDVSEPINNNVQPSTPNSKSEETTSK